MRRQRYHRDANPPSTIPVLLLSSVQSKKRCVESVKESTEFLKRQYEKLDNQFKDPFSAQVITPDSLRLLCLIGPVLKAHDKVVFHVFAYNCEPKQIPFIILWRGRKFNNQSRAFCSTVVVSQRPPTSCTTTLQWQRGNSGTPGGVSLLLMEVGQAETGSCFHASITFDLCLWFLPDSDAKHITACNFASLQYNTTPTCNGIKAPGCRRRRQHVHTAALFLSAMIFALSVIESCLRNRTWIFHSFYDSASHCTLFWKVFYSSGCLEDVILFNRCQTYQIWWTK